MKYIQAEKVDCQTFGDIFTKRLYEEGYCHWQVVYFESRDYLCSSPGCMVVHIVLIAIDSDDYSTLSVCEKAIHAGVEIKISEQEAREKCFKMLKRKIKEKSKIFLPCKKCGSRKISFIVLSGDDTLTEGCKWVDVRCRKCSETAHFSVHPKENKAIEIRRNWNNMKGYNNGQVAE